MTIKTNFKLFKNPIHLKLKKLNQTKNYSKIYQMVK